MQTATSSISAYNPNDVLLAHYIDILEKTNAQLGLWTNPYGIMVGALAVLFAVIAFGLSYYVWKISRDQKKEFQDILNDARREFHDTSNRFMRETVEERLASIDLLVEEKKELVNANISNRENALAEWLDKIKSDAVKQVNSLEKIRAKSEKQLGRYSREMNISEKQRGNHLKKMNISVDGKCVQCGSSLRGNLFYDSLLSTNQGFSTEINDLSSIYLNKYNPRKNFEKVICSKCSKENYTPNM